MAYQFKQLISQGEGDVNDLNNQFIYGQQATGNLDQNDVIDQQQLLALLQGLQNSDSASG